MIFVKNVIFTSSYNSLKYSASLLSFGLLISLLATNLITVGCSGDNKKTVESPNDNETETDKNNGISENQDPADGDASVKDPNISDEDDGKGDPNAVKQETNPEITGPEKPEITEQSACQDTSDIDARKKDPSAEDEELPKLDAAVSPNTIAGIDQLFQMERPANIERVFGSDDNVVYIIPTENIDASRTWRSTRGTGVAIGGSGTADGRIDLRVYEQGECQRRLIRQFFVSVSDYKWRTEIGKLRDGSTYDVEMRIIDEEDRVFASSKNNDAHFVEKQSFRIAWNNVEERNLTIDNPNANLIFPLDNVYLSGEYTGGLRFKLEKLISKDSTDTLFDGDYQIDMQSGKYEDRSTTYSVSGLGFWSLTPGIFDALTANTTTAPGDRFRLTLGTVSPLSGEKDVKSVEFQVDKPKSELLVDCNDLPATNDGDYQKSYADPTKVRPIAEVKPFWELSSGSSIRIASPGGGARQLRLIPTILNCAQTNYCVADLDLSQKTGESARGLFTSDVITVPANTTLDLSFRYQTKGIESFLVAVHDAVRGGEWTVATVDENMRIVFRGQPGLEDPVNIPASYLYASFLDDYDNYRYRGDIPNFDLYARYYSEIHSDVIAGVVRGSWIGREFSSPRAENSFRSHYLAGTSYDPRDRFLSSTNSYYLLGHFQNPFIEYYTNPDTANEYTAMAVSKVAGIEYPDRNMAVLHETSERNGLHSLSYFIQSIFDNAYGYGAYVGGPNLNHVPLPEHLPGLAARFRQESEDLTAFTEWKTASIIYENVSNAPVELRLSFAIRKTVTDTADTPALFGAAAPRIDLDDFAVNSCKTTVCGNGVTELPYEQCDAGGKGSTSCSANCTRIKAK